MRPGMTLLAIAAFSMSWATSCSLTSLDVHGDPLPIARLLSPVDPQTVRILRKPPATAYQVVGMIRVGWFGIRTDEEILADPAIQSALRQQAARMGADGVTSIVLLRRGGNARSPEAFSSYLVATAIRSGGWPRRLVARI